MHFQSLVTRSVLVDFDKVTEAGAVCGAWQDMLH